MTTRRVDMRVLRALAALAGESPFVDEMGSQLYGVGVELWGEHRKTAMRLPLDEARSWWYAVREPGYGEGDRNEPLEGESYRDALDAFIAGVAERLGMVEYRVGSLCEHLEGMLR